MSKTYADSELPFDPSMLKSIKMTFELENVTTRMKAEKPEFIKLLEHSGKDLVLEIPKRVCSTGHMLVLNMCASDPTTKKEYKFNATVKVTKMEPGEDGLDRAEVTLVQFEQAMWDQIVALYANRQAQIMEFFQAVKG